MLVEDIMIRQVHVVGPETTVLEALTLAERKRVRHLPVVDEGRLLGIISDRDLRDVKPSILEADNLEILSTTRVKDIVHTSIITVHPLDAIEDAAKMLYDHRIGCLPVVQAGKLVGIITTTDLLHAIVDMMGMGQPGSYLEVEVPDRPGALLDIARIMKAHGVNIISTFVNPARQRSSRVIALRIATFDPRQIIQEIGEAGYAVVFPMALKGE
ncbi:CBS domain-containing protein [Heliobacterium undosum]|uniref:CBS domain-containing protein n=1 Tax=Heliomicrobium undosum TaxID=121734 RepID=A0A845L0Q9_9FIRM|nr:CBS and ACT domain-containing protein [Heliomicrobium undosum]MZP28509.1 CBS domain-containing protein [Heliomicrobium undosum]